MHGKKFCRIISSLLECTAATVNTTAAAVKKSVVNTIADSAADLSDCSY